MKCPYCDNIDTKVIDSRPTEEGHAIRRRRGCDKCGRRLEGGEEEEEKKEEEKVPTNKVCPNCGWTIFDIETMFCDKCGRRLEVAE